MSTNMKWICFHLAGYGEVFAKVAGGVLPNVDFTVSHPCATFMQPDGGRKIGKHLAAQLGLADGGMHIERSLVTWWGVCSAEVAGYCDAAWSQIQKPKPGEIHRLAGRNGGRST